MGFTDSVTASMEAISSAFETTTKQLEKASTLSPVARLPFSSDPQYVEFKTTIAAVRTALESEITGPVVTIFGGPGQGKSSMARHLALSYQYTSTMESPSETVHGEVLPRQDLASKRSEDGVFFLCCGPDADSKDDLVNLWQDLGYPLLSSTIEANQDQATSSNRTQQSVQSESVLLRELTKRLSSQKLLIVLDDVWEPLPTLVKSLELINSEQFYILNMATKILSIFSLHIPLRIKIGLVPDAIHNLLALLDRDGNRDAQKWYSKG